MKKIQFCLLLILFAIAFLSCKENKTKTNRLVGTWRLIKYEDYDSTSGKWIQPYGEHPKGFFTYTESGVVNLNGSSEIPFVSTNDTANQKLFTLTGAINEVNNLYAFGYFGTYTLNEADSTLIHHPAGGSIPEYIGTNQYRKYIIRGDTLFIGDPDFTIGKRTLIREK